jgi:hypothetical protein
VKENPVAYEFMPYELVFALNNAVLDKGTIPFTADVETTSAKKVPNTAAHSGRIAFAASTVSRGGHAIASKPVNAGCTVKS